MWTRMTVAFGALGLVAAADNAAQPVTSQPAPEKKICRRVVPTGTIMPKSICLTKAEWAKLDEIHDRGSAEAHRNRRAIGCGKMDTVLTCDQ